MSSAVTDVPQHPRHAIVAVGITALAIRVAVLLVGLFGTAAIGPPTGERSGPSASILAELPNRWDAGWYVGIASGGYRYRATGEVRFNRLAFFPAYPLALRATARALAVPRTSAAWAWVGVALSTGAFVWASVYVYWVARRWRPDVAHVAVLMLAAYPFGLFFGAVYTESFFLLGSAAVFWHFGQGAFGRTAAWGIFTGLVRPNGVLLALPLLLWAGMQDAPGTPVQRWKCRLAIVSPVVGTAIYSAYVWSLAGDPLAWISAQDSWGRTSLGLTGAAGDVLRTLRSVGLTGFLTERPYDFVNAAAGIFAIAALIPVGRTCGWPAAAFVAANLIPPLIVGGLPSLGRYTSVLFPLHVWLASASPVRLRGAVVTALALGQGLMATLHYSSRPLL